MTKKLMLGAALGALMVSGAFAQSTPPKPADNPSPPPAASTPAPAPAAKPADQNAAKPAEDKNASKPAEEKSAAKPADKNAAAQPQFVAEQKPDDFLASKFKGKEVLGSNGKKIGEIGDILFDKNGKILAYVISTGGFLGIGAKEVAMPPSAFQVEPDPKGGSDKLKISMDENQLKNAQKFTEYKKPQPVTTGAGGARGGLGGGGMGGGGMGGGAPR